MRVEILAIDDPRWRDVLRELRHDFYHRPEYVCLDAVRMQATPEAFVASDGDRVLFVPYLVRRCDSVRSEGRNAILDAISPYGYPGVLLNDAGRRTEFAATALAAFKAALAERGVCSAFLRMHPILGENFDTLFPAGTFGEASETVAIDLKLDEAALWEQMRQGHQETIKRCQKQGFVARFVPLIDVLDAFVVVYEQTMDRVKAKDAYYFGKEYFTALAHMDGVHCCVVEKDATIAAACLFFECGGIVQAHLGGTRTEFLQKSPFHMTLQHATSWAKARGNRWLHLGGGVGGAGDKLLHFKAGFSLARFQFRTAKLITNEADYLHLVAERATAQNTSPDALLASSFFPAYRS